MADAETTPQPPTENGADIAVDDTEEEESKVNSTMSTMMDWTQWRTRYFTGDYAYETKGGRDGKGGE
jgi:hypothetical protein